VNFDVADAVGDGAAAVDPKRRQALDKQSFGAAEIHLSYSSTPPASCGA
jgi:hypothetical protein